MADKLNKKLVDDNNFVTKRLNSANENLTNKKKDREKNNTLKEKTKEQRKLQRKQDIHNAGHNIKNAANTVAHPIKSTKNAISDSRERRKDAKNQKKEQKDLEKEYKAYKKSENKKNKELGKEARHERRAEGIKKLGNSVVNGGKSIGRGVNNGIQAVKHTKEVGAKGVAKEVGSAVKNKAKGLKNNTAKSISNKLNYKKQDVKNAFNRQKPVRAFKAVRDINRFRKEKGLKATAKAFGTMLKSGASDVLDNIINSKAVQFIVKHKTTLTVSAVLTTSVVGMSSIAIGYSNTLKGSPSYYCAQGENVPSEIVNSVEYQLYCLGDPCGMNNNKRNKTTSSGDFNASEQAEENAKKIYSVFKTYGLKDEAIAGMLGVMSAESGVLSKRIEGDGISDFSSVSDVDKIHNYCANTLFVNYNSRGTDYNPAGYLVDGKYMPGLGLIQFTAGRAKKLIEFANTNNMEWYDIDTQLIFLLSGQDTPNSYFENWAQNGNGSPTEECRYFFWTNVYASNFSSRDGFDTSKRMINDNGTNYETVRASKAEGWYSKFASFEVDKEYGEKIIEKAGAAKPGKSNGKTNKVSRTCKKTVNPEGAITDLHSFNLTEFLEHIDTAKYYQFDREGVNGSKNVCHIDNNIAWPYSDCIGLSGSKSWNKMICSSYASSRFWEVNYSDEDYPLPTNWDAQMTLNGVSEVGGFRVERDKNNIEPGSILTLGNHSAGWLHAVFLESILDNGHIIVSEGNWSGAWDRVLGLNGVPAQTSAESRPSPNGSAYGFTIAEYDSIDHFLLEKGGAYFIGALCP